MLFTPGPRLGWTYTDHRTLIQRYPEPPPDPEKIRQQAADRLAAARRSWQRALKWALRPSLMVLIALLALGGCAHAFNHNAPFGTMIVIAVVLALPGTGWTLWRFARRNLAKDADPQHQYQAADEGWRQRAVAHEQAGLAQLTGVPEWGSADAPSRRTDVFGGTLAGWRCLLTVHGASVLAERPLLVADFTGQDAAGDLAALTRHLGVQSAGYVLPRDLNASGLLARLSPSQLAGVLAEAIHAGVPGPVRSDRAVDVRILEQLCGALRSGGITLARLSAATETALGRTPARRLLVPDEIDFIKGPLFGEGYKQQVAANFVRLDAFLSDLARYDGDRRPVSAAPAYCTFFVAQPTARSAHAEMLAALIIQWLTVQVTAGTADAPAVIVAGADEITGHHLERLADACDRSSMPLTLLFRHLRNDATTLVGGGATAFMQLGNHHEAEQAASFIGRQHKFVLSSLTATHGGNQAITHGQTESWGQGESRGFSSSHGWSRDHLLGGGSTTGGSSQSRDYSKNYSWAAEFSQSDGTNWSDASTRQRVYEYAVEPAVLQRLPETALLLVGRNGDVQPVECHPAIVTLPRVGTAPVDSVDVLDRTNVVPPAAARHPELVPHEPQPDWTQDPYESERPAWPPQDPPDQW